MQKLMRRPEYLFFVIVAVFLWGCNAGGEIEDQPATIAGSVDGYRGDSPVIVVVYDNPELEENSQTLRWETASTSYDFARYISYGNWWLIAFVDTNGDDKFTAGEPYGNYEYNPVELDQNNIIETGVTIVIDSE